MWKRISNLLVVMVVVVTLVAPMAKAGTVEGDCARAAMFPQCGWCWSECVYAIIQDLWGSPGYGWDWDAR